MHNDVYTLIQVTSSIRQVLLDSYVFLAGEDEYINFQTSTAEYGFSFGFTILISHTFFK